MIYIYIYVYIPCTMQYNFYTGGISMMEDGGYILRETGDYF